jgi:succinyl-CoA synthetase beta subunit
VLDEHDAGRMLRDFGMPVNEGRLAADEAQARAAARELGFPVALKTAGRGIHHKWERGGVHLDLADEAAVAAAWRELATSHGPRVLVAPMVRERGVELLLGVIRDEQFGPLVALGLGGVHVEALADVAFLMPPFGAADARRALGRLQHRGLLASRRFAGGLALDAFCEMAARLSALATSLDDVVAEIDVNPVIVHAAGCIAVDALVAGRAVGSAISARRAV